MIDLSRYKVVYAVQPFRILTAKKKPSKHGTDGTEGSAMFNTSVSNEFSYNINAVSGTIRKSHPKSKFCVRRVDDRQWVFDDEKPRLVGDKWREEIVILQAMLTGENMVLIEYVRKDDFEPVDGGKENAV